MEKVSQERGQEASVQRKEGLGRPSARGEWGPGTGGELRKLRKASSEKM